jgi:hypothetical protein
MDTIQHVDCARTPVGASTSSTRYDEHEVAVKASARRARAMAMHPSNYRGLKCVSPLVVAGASTDVDAGSRRAGVHE